MSNDTDDVVEISAFCLDIGDQFKHPDTDEWVEAIDRTQPMKYGPAVYAYADPDNGEYEGTFTSNAENIGGPTVEARRTGPKTVEEAVDDIPISEVPKADGMFEDVEWIDSDTISVVHTVGDRRFRLTASVFAAHEISESEDDQ